MKTQHDSTVRFLTEYLCSLKERTRLEKGLVKNGFDWIIYQIGLSKSWMPFRLPFFRLSGEAVPKSKVEIEFGDMSFIDSETLYVFVLKDEELNNKNWITHNFDADIRKAATPKIEKEELKRIKSVRVILAYNKDEDQGGIECYERLINSLGDRTHNVIKLSFERWNLTKIVQEVEEQLITPNLLPQHLAWQFHYICSQVKDFDYGTEQWDNQLVPNWRDFINNVLFSSKDEDKYRLIPVTIMIIDHYRKDVPNSYPGWIDLIEWAMLAMWNSYKKLEKSEKTKKCGQIINQIWFQLYLVELERYLLTVEKVFTTKHGFTSCRKNVPTTVAPINDAYLAFWHLGRLGILTLGPQEYVKEATPEIKIMLERTAGWLVECLRNNPAALRPLIDLHHIELFLIWMTFWQTGWTKDAYEWLSELESRLLMRRSKKNFAIPFIESQNRLDLVAEHAARGERPYDYTDKTSYLLLMILEICLSFDDKYRDELVQRYMNRVVKGLGDDGTKLTDDENIDLMSWVPPNDWSERILNGPVLDGVAITTGNFGQSEESEENYAERIKNLVEETRRKFPWKIDRSIPQTVYVLACIKNKSPLPPEFWRQFVFPENATLPKR